MAIYHLSVQIISRGDGRSAVASAAYRAAEKIESLYDGITSDYTRKENVLYSDVMLPENAPEAYGDRARLWNAVEMAEVGRNAQLVREINVALPVELSLVEQTELLRDYVQANFVDRGMIADICIHNPPVMDDRHRPLDREGNPTKKPEEMVFRNPHAHIMLTMRPIAPDGKWEAKAHKEYICRRGDEEKSFTAAEFKSAAADGWEKQYQYKTDGGRRWMTKSAGEARGYERANRNPKAVDVQNPTAAYWNDRARMEDWRALWAEYANSALEKAGFEERIDHRSNKERGIDETPMVHMNPAATAIEKRADRLVRNGASESEVKRSFPGDINREIKEGRRLRALMGRMVGKAEKAAKNAAAAVKSMAERLEGIRVGLIGMEYYRDRAAAADIRLRRSEERAKGGMEIITASDTVTANARAELGRLTERLKGSPKRGEKKRLQEEISRYREIIERQTELRDRQLADLGMPSEGEAKKLSRLCTEERAKMDGEMERLEAAEGTELGSYREILAEIKDMDATALASAREEIRPEAERKIKEKLQKDEGGRYSKEAFDAARKSTDEKLDAEEAAVAGRAKGYEERKEEKGRGRKR